MRTIRIKLYKFNELSESAKEKAIESLSDINVYHDWWQFIYEDAENIGLKITSFDLDRNRHAEGEFTGYAIDTAKDILEEHGKDCETYKTAEKFMSDYYNTLDEDIEELEEEFLKSLLEDYSIMLQTECDYLMSEKAIIETIEANEYEFTQDGKLN
jgi:hypothetical protein